MKDVQNGQAVQNVQSFQGSLLDLFEQQFAEAIGPRPRVSTTVDVGANRIRPSEPNPFRKQTGVCAHCADESAEGRISQSIAKADATVRVFWCHLCRKTGCFEWLKNHKD